MQSSLKLQTFVTFIAIYFSSVIGNIGTQTLDLGMMSQVFYHFAYAVGMQLRVNCSSYINYLNGGYILIRMNKCFLLINIFLRSFLNRL
jgi:hypothetical protein